MHPQGASPSAHPALVSPVKEGRRKVRPDGGGALQDILAVLEARRAEARIGGGERRIAAQHAKGKLTARERIEALFQPGTFMEFGLHADHTCTRFGMEKRSMPGDGVITGVGYIDGRPVAAYSQDFTVGGGALGRIHAKKICEVTIRGETAPLMEKVNFCKKHFFHERQLPRKPDLAVNPNALEIPLHSFHATILPCVG